MSQEMSEIQPDAAIATPAPIAIWAGLFALGGLAMVVWFGVSKLFDVMAMRPIEFWIFCVVALLLMTIGLALHMLQFQTSAGARLASLVEHDTWFQCATLATVMTGVTILSVSVGARLGGEAGEILFNALAPALCFASGALVCYSIFAAGATGKLHLPFWARVLLALCWVLGLGGLILMTASSLFFKLPIWLLTAVAVCFALAGILTWWAFSEQELGPQQSGSRREFKLGLYQAALVPLVCVAAAALASPQLAPLYTLIGVVTLALGLKKLSGIFMA